MPRRGWLGEHLNTDGSPISLAAKTPGSMRRGGWQYVGCRQYPDTQPSTRCLQSQSSLFDTELVSSNSSMTSESLTVLVEPNVRDVTCYR